MPSRIEPPSSDCWEAFAPSQLHARLEGTAGVWYVAGGVALDLWHEASTREHGDLEFCVLREQLGTFRAALHGFDLFCAKSGELSWLPDNQEPPDDAWQFWGLDPGARVWRFDMMVEPGTAATWRYKRDPSLGLPRGRAVRVSPDGVPYLAPALVLLFKAKAARPKDELDLRNALPRLLPSDRLWLAKQIGRFHPGHPWLVLC